MHESREFPLELQLGRRLWAGQLDRLVRTTCAVYGDRGIRVGGKASDNGGRGHQGRLVGH